MRAGSPQLLFGLVAVLMLVTSVFVAFRTPTFDFDEALYRRVAEEMKTSHRYSTMTWDGRPFLEKPPTFVWTIVASSWLIDGDSRNVSVIAARFPSLVFSFLTLLCLSLFWTHFRKEYVTEGDSQSPSSPLLPVIAFGAALFPMIQATSVLLDPMLTLFSTIVLLVFSAASLRRQGAPFELRRRDIVIAATAMTVAVAVKGLIGFVAPAIALAVHDILSAISERQRCPFAVGLRRRLAGTAIGAAPVFILAAVFSSVVFYLFYRAAGFGFIYEFLIRQHFVRGARAFQGHRGPLFYYVLLLALGGPAAAFLGIGLLANKRVTAKFSMWGLPVSWSIGLIVFISCLATKLPNYTWPAWPAIALSLSIVVVRLSAVSASGRKETLSKVAGIVAICGGLGSLLLAAASMMLSLRFDLLVSAAARSPRTHAILRLLDPLPSTVRIALALTSVAFVTLGLLQWKFARVTGRHATRSRVIAAACVMNCLVLILVSQAVVPYVDKTIRAPLVHIAQVASAKIPNSQPLETIGLFSPTISSNYSGDHLNQIGTQPSAGRVATYLITPVWHPASCTTKTSHLIAVDKYLLLCSINLSGKGVRL